MVKKTRHIIHHEERLEHVVNSRCICNPSAKAMPNGDLFFFHNSLHGRPPIEVYGKLEKGGIKKRQKP